MNLKKHMCRIVCAVMYGVFSAGCASNIPLEIRNPTVDKLPLSEVQPKVRDYQGKIVRWGGTIVEVENKEAATWLVLLGKELGRFGRPEVTDKTEGRFIARVDGFLDPAIYKQDRDVTVYGPIESFIERKIVETPYTYPVVKADRLHLWQEYRYSRNRYPYYFDDYYYYPYRGFSPYYSAYPLGFRRGLLYCY